MENRLTTLKNIFEIFLFNAYKCLGHSEYICIYQTLNKIYTGKNFKEILNKIREGCHDCQELKFMIQFKFNKKKS